MLILPAFFVDRDYASGQTIWVRLVLGGRCVKLAARIRCCTNGPSRNNLERLEKQHALEKGHVTVLMKFGRILGLQVHLAGAGVAGCHSWVPWVPR